MMKERDPTRNAFKWVLYRSRRALAHMPCGPERDELEESLAWGQGRFDQLAKELETGDCVAAWHSVGWLLLTGFILGASTRALPESMVKMRALAAAAARDSKKTGDAERHRALLAAIGRVCESRGRKPRASIECVDEIRDSVCEELGRSVGKVQLKKALGQLRKDKSVQF